MSLKFALVGNPNSGKTTLFNEITGSTQYVGNWPGVTIEKKEGRVKRLQEDVRIVDLPGIYSLSPYSMEEIVARDFILDEKPDVIINIVDATNIERNLYLTTQVVELGIPVVVALNMMDAVEARGDRIDVRKLSVELKLPVIPMSASKGQGVTEIVDAALEAADGTPGKSEDVVSAVYDEAIAGYIFRVADEIAGNSAGYGRQNSCWTAIKLLEADTGVLKKVNLAEDDLQKLTEYRNILEKEYDNDMETIIADNRYRYVTGITGITVRKKAPGHHLTVSDKIDRVVTNRLLAIPLFFGVMLLIFRITFGTVGSLITGKVGNLIKGTFTGWVAGLLKEAGTSDWLNALILNGIIGGVGSVVVFIPQLMILFFFLSLLEDTGYMARGAFVMDRFLRKLGLSGKSFIPMLMGFGCSVPAVMSTRTLENEKDRRLTIILTPFMSCSARLPVYLMFAGAFFSRNQDLVVFSIYILGIVVAVLSGILLKNTVFKGQTAPFVMELPPYRLPTLKSLMIHMWERLKDFLKRAGTVIFAAAAIIWMLQSFNFSFHMVEDPGQSILGAVGGLIAPIFKPAGFGDWKSAVALITGFVAKESVVSTMGILHGVAGSGDNAALGVALRSVFTPLSAYAFMAFTLLYLPCMAAFATIRKELGSWKWTFFTVGYQTGTAWIAAFIIYQAGRLAGLG